MVPGLYSLWMRAWDAKVGAFVYWSPGVRILDRPLLNVGSRVVFGAGVRLNGHVVLPRDDGSMQLAVGTIRLGSDTLVGGYSLLLAGVHVADAQVTPPLRTLQPFTT
jgi:acetyltransferase-like isoleucine patch superfamily enzyme